MGDISGLGERLSALRKVAGLSQNELAEKLGISRSSYQYYERNERDLPSSLLLTICELFDDDAHRILTGHPSGLVMRRIEEISALINEYEEDVDVEFKPETRLRVLAKVLRDEFRTHPSMNQREISDEIDSLYRMLK
ncbi:MAG: helix-turn-helix domain-containing protein [Hyphomicrobiaceae bacterium]